MASCAVGCGVYWGVRQFIMTKPEKIMRYTVEKYPYEETKGKKLNFSFGGGHFKQYDIQDRHDYDIMMADVRHEWHNKREREETAWSPAGLFCMCAFQLKFHF